MNCIHENFYCHCEVARCTDNDVNVILEYRLDVRVKCTQCGQEFEFMGLPRGYDPSFPTVSADGLELRQPIRPSKDPFVAGPKINN